MKIASDMPINGHRRGLCHRDYVLGSYKHKESISRPKNIEIDNLYDSLIELQNIRYYAHISWTWAWPWAIETTSKNLINMWNRFLVPNNIRAVYKGRPANGEGGGGWWF